MSILDFGALDNRQEVIALAVVIICPKCESRVLAMGPALNEVACPNCQRPYGKNTRQIMKECLARNKAHRG